MKSIRNTLFTTLLSALMLTACGADTPEDPGAPETQNRSAPAGKGPNAVGDLETVVAFPPFTGPQSIVVDRHDPSILYVTLSLSGEIARVDTAAGTQEVVATLPIGTPLEPCGAFIGIVGAAAMTPDNVVYVNVNSCLEGMSGVWAWNPATNDQYMVAALEEPALINGIALRNGRIYVADAAFGKILSAPMGGGSLELWHTDPLLVPVPIEVAPGIFAPGPNGLQFYLNELLVANSSANTIVGIKLQGPASNPIPAQTYVKYTLDQSEGFLGCDDFAVDVMGRIYCTTDPGQKLVRINRNGSMDVLFSGDDGLDGPTACVFGRGSDSKTLYISNAAYPFFPGTGFGATVQKVELGVPGFPNR